VLREARDVLAVPHVLSKRYRLGVRHSRTHSPSDRGADNDACTFGVAYQLGPDGAALACPHGHRPANGAADERPDVQRQHVLSNAVADSFASDDPPRRGRQGGEERRLRYRRHL